jgi:hypothetical protein
MPLSSPTALANAAAASTRRIRLGTTLTVLSTDEPIRVFQLATAAAIAPGRIEPSPGRGSSDITFLLFNLDVRDYDMLYRSKLDLLLQLNNNERATWSGPHRQRPLDDTLVVPRPEQPLKIWLGTGGSPESVMRAVELGLPMFLDPRLRRRQRPPGQDDLPRIRDADVARGWPRSAAPHCPQPAAPPTTGRAGWSSPAGRTKSPSASSTYTSSSARHARSCRWTSAACRTPPSSRASNCSAPKSSHRSEGARCQAGAGRHVEEH